MIPRPEMRSAVFSFNESGKLVGWIIFYVFFLMGSPAASQVPTFTFTNTPSLTPTVALTGTDTPTPTPFCFQGLIEAPTAVAVAAPQFGMDLFHGKVYLADSDSSSIFVYTAGLVSPSSWVATGGLQEAEGLALGPDGFLYISEDTGDKVQVLDPSNGANLATLSLPGNGRGIFVDSNGDIYACVLNQAILWFRRQSSCGAPAYDLGTALTLTGDPNAASNPLFENVWKEGADLYVFENYDSIVKLLKYHQDSQIAVYDYVSTIGDSGPQALVDPSSMTKDFGGTYYVLSAGDGSVVAYDSGFNVIGRFQSGHFVASSCLGVDKDGHVFVEEGAGNLAQISQTCFPLGVPPPTSTPLPTCSFSPTSTPTATATLTATPTSNLSMPIQGGAIPSYVYPDPAPPGPARLAFYLKSPDQVLIHIYNAAGERVESLTVAGFVGVNSVPLDFSRYAHGIYYCVLRSFGSADELISTPVKFVVTSR